MTNQLRQRQRRRRKTTPLSSQCGCCSAVGSLYKVGTKYYSSRYSRKNTVLHATLDGINKQFQPPFQSSLQTTENCFRKRNPDGMMLVLSYIFMAYSYCNYLPSRSDSFLRDYIRVRETITFYRAVFGNQTI